MTATPHDRISAALQDAAAARDERLRQRLGQSVDDIAAMSADEWRGMSEHGREMLLAEIEGRGHDAGRRAASASPPAIKLKQTTAGVSRLTLAWIRIANLPPLRSALATGLLLAFATTCGQIASAALSGVGLAANNSSGQETIGICRRLDPTSRGCRYAVERGVTLQQAAAYTGMNPADLRGANTHISWPATAGATITIPGRRAQP